jgi:hypothetical protein
MSSKVFFYCLKVWLASVVLGPALFWCLLPSLDREAPYTFGFFLSFWGYGILYGLAFSLISFLIFLVCVIYISHQNWPFGQRRLAAGVMAIALTVVPFMILFGTVNILPLVERVLFCSCYLLPILAGIFFYRFPLTGRGKN